MLQQLQLNQISETIKEYYNTGPSIKDVRSKGAGVWTNVDDRGQTRGVNHRPDVDKRRNFCISESISKSAHPPVHRHPDRKDFVRFRRLRAVQSGRSWKGGGVFQTNDVGQGGGVPKSHFLVGRFWWMSPNVVQFF